MYSTHKLLIIVISIFYMKINLFHNYIILKTHIITFIPPEIKYFDSNPISCGLPFVQKLPP